jgi:hypothetical protein
MHRDARQLINRDNYIRFDSHPFHHPGAYERSDYSRYPEQRGPGDSYGFESTDVRSVLCWHLVRILRQCHRHRQQRQRSMRQRLVRAALPVSSPPRPYISPAPAKPEN